MLGHYNLTLDSKKEFQVEIKDHKIVVSNSIKSFLYRRYEGEEIKTELMIIPDGRDVTIGLFASPPLFTPKKVSRNVFLKFKTPVILEQMQVTEIYAKIPIEIGIYRQSKDEELLFDIFSLNRQQYTLYGNPENGVVCRYKETEVSTTPLETNQFEEALIRLRIKNNLGNIVKVTKAIIPMDGVILDHTDDNVTIFGNVEMNLNSVFGKDIVNVQLVRTKVKRSDKTSAELQENTLTFLMDSGY